MFVLLVVCISSRTLSTLGHYNQACDSRPLKLQTIVSDKIEGLSSEVAVRLNAGGSLRDQNLSIIIATCTVVVLTCRNFTMILLTTMPIKL